MNGFAVTLTDVDELSELETKYGVPDELAACHIALVQGYVIEGHVPADLILEILKKRPKIVGLAVPGMPQGSPGMEHGEEEPYQVFTFDKEGRTTVYAER